MMIPKINGWRLFVRNRFERAIVYWLYGLVIVMKVFVLMLMINGICDLICGLNLPLCVQDYMSNVVCEWIYILRVCVWVDDEYVGEVCVKKMLLEIFYGGLFLRKF
jgi:hypothetical protein